jgi:hypothetical protein
LGPPTLLSNGEYRGLFAQGQSGRGIKFITDLQSVLRLSMGFTSELWNAFTGRTLIKDRDIYAIIHYTKFNAVHSLSLHAHVIPKSNPVKAYAHVCVSFQLLFTEIDPLSYV